MTGLEVLDTGPLSLIQDLGRPGFLSSGVGASGAADRRSAALANRLVGNDVGSAVLEVLIGGLVLRARETAVVAVTGAPAQALLDDTPVGHASVLVMAPGQTLRVRHATVGLRVYVAVRGGVAVPAVLGSRATDTLSGLGPEPVQPNDILPIGAARRSLPAVDLAPVASMTAGEVTVRVVMGPRDDWFTDAGVLTTGYWVVSADTDRIGARLSRGEGPPLTRARSGELPTEGMVLGSVQVPPSGQPVVFLADHPVTGGYPVVAVVRDADVDLVAQARPGQRIRFTTG